MANNAQSKLVLATAEVTGRRWCVNHGGEVETTAGSVIMRGKQRQFTCFNCQDRRNAHLSSAR